MANKKKEKRGLGSPKMDEKTKHDIQSKGGKSSHKGDKENAGVEEYGSEYYEELRMPGSGSKSKSVDEGVNSPDLDRDLDLTEDWDEE